MKHAKNPLNQEFSLCGQAYDTDEVDPDIPTHDYAGPGESLDCPECKEVIREVYDLYTPKGRVRRMK